MHVSHAMFELENSGREAQAIKVRPALLPNNRSYRLDMCNVPTGVQRRGPALQRMTQAIYGERVYEGSPIKRHRSQSLRKLWLDIGDLQELRKERKQDSEEGNPDDDETDGVILVRRNELLLELFLRVTTLSLVLLAPGLFLPPLCYIILQQFWIQPEVFTRLALLHYRLPGIRRNDGLGDRLPRTIYERDKFLFWSFSSANLPRSPLSLERVYRSQAQTFALSQ
eukprot:3810754-Pleurochrysis_carterae.AAC.4